MSLNLGIFRTKQSMQEAQHAIQALQGTRTTHVRAGQGQIFNTDLIQGAGTSMPCGNCRDHRRAPWDVKKAGAHYRADFPTRNDTTWLRHTRSRRQPDGPQLTYTPVTIARFPLAKPVPPVDFPPHPLKIILGTPPTTNSSCALHILRYPLNDHRSLY